MRASTIALLTLSALAAQELNQQAAANSVPDPIPGQPPAYNHGQEATIATTYPTTSLPELVDTQQFTVAEALASEQSASLVVPLTSDDSTPRLVTIDTATMPDATVAVNDSPSPQRSAPQPEGINIPITPYPLPTVTNPLSSTELSQASPAQPLPNLEPVPTTVEIPSRSQVPPQTVQVNSRRQAAPVEPVPSVPPPSVTVSQRSLPFPPFSDSFIRQRRVNVNQLRSMRVTNRTRRSILIELVGRTSPLRLAPGQTRTLQVSPRDLSLLYWDPILPSEFNARVSQPDQRVLIVELFPSRFPNGSLGMYLPEPVRRSDILRIF